MSKRPQTTPFYVCQPCREQLLKKKCETGIRWQCGTCQYCAMKYVAVSDAGKELKNVA